MAFRISVDTGGTFTDLTVADRTGIVVVEKALTTPDRIFDGMFEAISAAARRLVLSTEQLLGRSDVLIFGTTRATNAIVQGKVAKTAMLLTEGFPDILVFREGGKSNAHEFGEDYPEPYIARRHTFEVAGRIDAEGQVVRPFDPTQALGVIDRLKRSAFEAIGVSFLWSIANPDHEMAMAELLDRHLPGIPYSLSHRLIPIIREYRRASATAIDASLKPLMQRHLREMADDMRSAGFTGEVLVSTSAGGSQHLEEAIERPIHLVKSGPSMGPVAGKVYAEVERLGGDLIVCDTGGTTFDVGLVRGGALAFTRETWLGPHWTGHMLGTPTVDVRSVGAGGGSIAWIDDGGLLRVGPQSAGSEPGPACYGRGGSEPTVTDAALVLGYIDPDYFLGGRIKLDAKAAERAVQDLAKRLGVPAERTAYAVITLASEHMIKAIHEITVNEGLDPADSAVVAGGGAAGLNILPIARELRCRNVILPRTAAALSACGMQFSDIVAERSASRLTTSNTFDRASVNAVLDRIDSELLRFAKTLERRGLKRYRIERFVEARYLYQAWELEVPLPTARFKSQTDVGKLVEAFHAAHERVFAVTDETNPVECLNWRGRITVRLNRPTERATKSPRSAKAAKPHGRRLAYFGGTCGTQTPVYRADQLCAGMHIQGPALVETPSTTVVLYPRTSARVSSAGHFILSPVPSRRSKRR